MHRFRYPIRIQLFALVAAVVLPLAGMLAYTIFADAQHAIGQAKSAARALAAITASDAARVVASNQDALRLMSRRPLVREVDAARCDPLLHEFRELFPRFANIGVINLAGDVLCSAVPQPGGKPASVAKTEWFQRAVAEDRFIVGQPFIGPITGKWVSVLAYPIHDAQEKLKGVLALPLDLAGYEPTISTAPLASDTVIGILTSDGTFVWGNRDFATWVGKNMRERAVMEELLAKRDGDAEGIGADAVHRFYAVAPVSGAGWYAYVGISSGTIYEQVAASALRNALLGFVILLAVTVLAVFLARRIELPVEALAATARAIKDGHTQVRARAEGPREVAEVAEEFNQMVDVCLRSDAALRQSEARFRGLTALSSDWFWEQDANFRFTEMSGGLVATHLKPELTLGKTRWELPIVGVTEAQWQAHRQCLERRQPFRDFVYQVETAPGELHWFSVNGKPVFGTAGEFVGYHGTGQDITGRKRAEQALESLNEQLERRVAERTAELEQINRELEAFSYSISHDLRAPLRAINGYASILKESLAERLSEEETRHFDRILKNSVHMGELIDDILQYSRITRNALKLEEVDLDQLVHAVAAELREAYPAAVVEIGPLPRVTGDPTMLRQVYQNLIDNALKYSSKCVAPRVEIGIRREDGKRVFYVMDNGAGFDMRFADKLFGVFQRMHPDSQFDGTGVGLAIVKRVIERHRGSIWADAEPDQGACFHFVLWEEASA